ATTSQPQAARPRPNPSAVTPAPNSPNRLRRSTRCPMAPPGSTRPVKTAPMTALRTYCSFPIAQATNTGTRMTSRNSTPRGQFRPAWLNANTFDSQVVALPRIPAWLATVGLRGGCRGRGLGSHALEQVIADPDGVRHGGQRRVDRPDAGEEA